MRWGCQREIYNHFNGFLTSLRGQFICQRPERRDRFRDNFFDLITTRSVDVVSE